MPSRARAAPAPWASSRSSRCPPQYFLHLPPAELGHRPRPRARVARMLRSRGAVDDALGDALQDRGDAKKVVRHVKVPVRRIDGAASAALAVHLHILAFCRNAQLRKIKPGDAAELSRRDVPAHAVI